MYNHKNYWEIYQLVSSKSEYLECIIKFNQLVLSWNIMNNKEKIRETLRMLDDLERYADSLNVGTKMLKKSLQKIRDVLDS